MTYLGYVEARLKIPGIKQMDKDSLFKDSPYTQRVSITIGTLHIRQALELATEEEMKQLWKVWEVGNFPPMTKQTSIKEPQLDLEEVCGKVTMTKDITIHAFDTIYVSWNTAFRKHSKQVNIMVDGLPEQYQRTVVPVQTYMVLKPGSMRIKFGLRNLSAQAVTIKSKTAIARFAAANAIPDMLAPSVEEENQSAKRGDPMLPSNREEGNKLLQKLDLSGILQWTMEQQEQVCNLFLEFDNLFALDSLDLGKTLIVKHKIRLSDNTPFKERYRQIPPHMYEEVKKHLWKMLEIGAIRKSNSPWASMVVLVRKKDGSLWFCIDLRQLNAHTIKDAYSLPRIEETLDCLGGACIFTSLDLKSGYWQVEMDEASKELTAFTVGPLGFYKCDKMPFGLTNAPAKFQRLMESCLGDLHLNWCIIYLDDMIVFASSPKEHIR